MARYVLWASLLSKHQNEKRKKKPLKKICVTVGNGISMKEKKNGGKKFEGCLILMRKMAIN